MAIDLKPGQTVRVNITKSVNRAAAAKTLERLFLLDKKVSAPLLARSKNFIELPKRRGGQIWTKRPNKVHPILSVGTTATFKTTPETLRALNSVQDFVKVASA